MDEAVNSFPGKVEEILGSTEAGGTEKVEISIETGDVPDQKIHVKNVLTDAKGEAVSLKRGEKIHIVIRPRP
jgi:hypothetical protein